jgi:hypothetical protein
MKRAAARMRLVFLGIDAATGSVSPARAVRSEEKRLRVSVSFRSL